MSFQLDPGDGVRRSVVASSVRVTLGSPKLDGYLSPRAGGSIKLDGAVRGTASAGADIAGSYRVRLKRSGASDEVVSDGELETQANEFAQDLLIPPDAAELLKDLQTRAEIMDFASKLKIPPGLVVGRMQREGYLAWPQHNDLRRRFALVES